MLSGELPWHFRTHWTNGDCRDSTTLCENELIDFTRGWQFGPALNYASISTKCFGHKKHAIPEDPRSSDGGMRQLRFILPTCAKKIPCPAGRVDYAGDLGPGER